MSDTLSEKLLDQSSLEPVFSTALLKWFDEHGRHDLPWQQAMTPYRVWVSEIMLQQTQVKTVIPYYERFMARFPTVEALASASQESVLAHWAGLGYYARGRNLHRAAQVVMNDFAGEFPTNFEDILALPGVGRSTAGAIMSLSLNQRVAILDGNVKRVLSRLLAREGWPGEKQNEQFLWLKADEYTPKTRFNDYTQAIMDLGATLCTRSKPNCMQCPVSHLCQAKALDRVSEFPFSKPKKVKPIKQTYLMILENQQGEIWLEQRPQKGIWGGLWSFPEYSCPKSRLEALKKRQSKTVGDESLLEWEVLRHTFSHYHLDIHPMIFRKGSFKEGEAASKRNGQWVNKSRLNAAENGLGVPAPVTKLINFMESNHE